MTDDGRPVHYLTPEGGMTHALHTLTPPPVTTHDQAEVTCPACLERVVEVSATVDAGLTQEDLEGLSEAERLAMVVGAAYGNALAERDQARAQVARLGDALTNLSIVTRDAVQTLLSTSWAEDERLANTLQDAIAAADVALGSVPAPRNQED